MKAACSRTASESERHDMVTDIVTRVVAAVLRLPIADVDPGMPLRHVGLDSLMALELRNTLQDRAGVTVSLVALVEGPSVSELTTLILERAGRHIAAADTDQRGRVRSSAGTRRSPAQPGRRAVR